MKTKCVLVFVVLTEIALCQSISWISTNGPSARVVKSLAVASAGDLFAGTSDSGVYVTTNLGGTWRATNLGNMDVNDISVTSFGIFAGTRQGGVYRTSDNGNTWTHVTTGMTNLYVLTLTSDSNNRLFAGTFGIPGVYRSLDSAASWTGGSSGLTSTTVPSVRVAPNGYVFAGTRYYPTPGGERGGVYRSTDHGQTWTHAGLINAFIISLSTSLPGYTLAGTYDGYVCRSTDHGDSWLCVRPRLGSVNAFVVNRLGHIYAGFSSLNGVLKSSDNGNSWNPVNDGIAGLSILSLALDSIGHLYAGTDGAGVFKTVQSTTDVSDIQFRLPTSFLLEQNFPNPFNPTTTIRFEIAERSHVLITVSDILGREISRPVNEKKSPGAYTVHFDARNLSSGVYFYRLQAGTFVETRKMLLAR